MDEENEQHFRSTDLSGEAMHTALMEALKFARETAKDEIESIDRLHKRTLLALTIPLSIFGLLFSVAGWIGYSNLKRVAVSTTTGIVKQQLSDQLTLRNIDASVQGALQDHALPQIEKAISVQISKQAPDLKLMMKTMAAQSIKDYRPELEKSARAQAQDYVKEIYEPRKIDSAHSSSLIACLKNTSKLPVNVAVGGDPEAQIYERQLAGALQNGGWPRSEQAMLGYHPELPRYGIAIVADAKLRDSDAVIGLQRCLGEANVSAKIYVPFNEGNEFSGQLNLVVLPKPR